MDEIEKLLEAANAGLRKAVEAAYEAGRQARGVLSPHRRRWR